MHVKRFADARPYEAPNHRGYHSLRVFGAEVGGTKGLVFGISHFLPGGGAGPDASPPEKVYLVLAGELTVGMVDVRGRSALGIDGDVLDHADDVEIRVTTSPQLLPHGPHVRK